MCSSDLENFYGNDDDESKYWYASEDVLPKKKELKDNDENKSEGALDNMEGDENDEGSVDEGSDDVIEEREKILQEMGMVKGEKINIEVEKEGESSNNANIIDKDEKIDNINIINSDVKNWSTEKFEVNDINTYYKKIKSIEKKKSLKLMEEQNLPAKVSPNKFDQKNKLEDFSILKDASVDFRDEMKKLKQTTTSIGKGHKAFEVSTVYCTCSSISLRFSLFFSFYFSLSLSHYLSLIQTHMHTHSLSLSHTHKLIRPQLTLSLPLSSGSIYFLQISC